MDVVTGLLNGPRANGAFLLRSVLDPPWSLHIEDGAPLTLIAVLTGTAWLVPDGQDARRLTPGGVAIVRGPEHYTVADEPTRSPTVIIRPGQLSTTVDGEELCEAMELGVRTWGTSSAGTVTMVTGTYQTSTEISRLLLDVLPSVIVVPEHGWDNRFLDLLGSELARDEPGQEVVLDRLLDLVLIAALRSWVDRAGADAPGRLTAHLDPLVRTALQLMYDDPAAPWTVAALAARSGVSRAAFARRFTSLMGVSPMAYLTEWRLALAADLLREPAATIATVARDVGYGSAFALSTAFKRSRGVSPHHYRRSATAS